MGEFITNGRLSFAEWIWGFEAYLAANPSATKAWAMSLKALYDADLVEEEQILEYYKGQHDSPGFDASKKAAAPFVKWLETGEDEALGEYEAEEKKEKKVRKSKKDKIRNQDDDEDEEEHGEAKEKKSKKEKKDKKEQKEKKDK